LDQTDRLETLTLPLMAASCSSVWLHESW
jgi:hypothetical protein